MIKSKISWTKHLPNTRFQTMTEDTFEQSTKPSNANIKVVYTRNFSSIFGGPLIYLFYLSFLGSFTELYINSLLHLVDHIDDMDEEHMKFLPDLQITETSCNKKDLGR